MNLNNLLNVRLEEDEQHIAWLTEAEAVGISGNQASRRGRQAGLRGPRALPSAGASRRDVAL